MADLTLLHAPSTLYLPESVETGLRFTFNRRSLPPPPLLCTTPMVTVEMVETGSPPSSPIKPEDTNFLSPPRRNFKSRRPLRDLPPRPSSAPPERPSGRITGGCISSPDLLLPPPHTADPLSGRSYATPVLVRPPTTLCACTPPSVSNVFFFLTLPSLPFPQSVRSRFGGIPDGRVSQSRSTRRPCIPSAAQPS
jgi:hypothetical protein